MNDQLTAENELHILGKQNIAGYQFTGIEGGFGEGKKAMLVKEIADIHSKGWNHVNELINRNIKRFKDNIDIVDLKSNRSERLQLSELGFTNMQIAKANNIYLLSERGYSKLLKILEDDT
ncbi:ORF6N domain-containing protein, partial [Bacillus cereus]